jgi:hypothetical protein
MPPHRIPKTNINQSKYKLEQFVRVFILKFAFLALSGKYQFKLVVATLKEITMPISPPRLPTRSPPPEADEPRTPPEQVVVRSLYDENSRPPELTRRQSYLPPTEAISRFVRAPQSTHVAEAAATHLRAENQRLVAEQQALLGGLAALLERHQAEAAPQPGMAPDTPGSAAQHARTAQVNGHHPYAALRRLAQGGVRATTRQNILPVARDLSDEMAQAVAQNSLVQIQATVFEQIETQYMAHQINSDLSELIKNSLTNRIIMNIENHSVTETTPLTREMQETRLIRNLQAKALVESQLPHLADMYRAVAACTEVADENFLLPAEHQSILQLTLDDAANYANEVLECAGSNEMVHATSLRD